MKNVRTFICNRKNKMRMRSPLFRCIIHIMLLLHLIPRKSDIMVFVSNYFNIVKLRKSKLTKGSIYVLEFDHVRWNSVFTDQHQACVLNIFMRKLLDLISQAPKEKILNLMTIFNNTIFSSSMSEDCLI